MTALGEATGHRAPACGLLHRFPMRRFLPILALAALLFARSAGAACAPVSSANGLCTSMQGNTCFVSSKQCPVVNGSTLDFGTKDVVFRQSSSLNVGIGTMTIKAGSLELQPGTALLGAGGTIIVQTTGDITVLRPSQGSPGRIDVADPVAADGIQLASGGTIRIDGIVDARGTNTDGFGGSVDLTATNILVSGEVRTGGGPLGGAGPVLMDAQGGGITLTAPSRVDAFGGFGSLLEITADTTIATAGVIDIRATAAGADAGSFFMLTNTGSITLGGKIFMQGDEGTDLDGGGNGGDLTVLAAGALTISADIEASGAPPDGQGGELLFTSILDMVQTGLIQAQGRGAESDGGSVTFDSQQGLQVGNVDVHGAENIPDTGGDVTGSSWCALTMLAGRTLDARGDLGSIVLQAGGQMTLAGALKAGSPITLEYLTTPPVTGGASFSPASPIPHQNTTLTPCGGIPPASCGDGVMDEGEDCDDHNTVSCDGCSSTCKIEECGNGRIDCRPSTGTPEACDDGNTTSGDTCHDDCSRFDNVCGDSIIDPEEQCDVGDANACDGCSATCQTESCGNGVVECQEECDPPNVGGCNATCTKLVPPGCGDGTTAGDEECDDGNTNDGDGCSHQCRKERCGNGTIDMGEECDDFNVVCGDGCSPTCKIETCGNGILDCDEECDDGPLNGAPGGTCRADVCRPAPRCTDQSGSDPCIPCATSGDCSDPDACTLAACADGVCTDGAPRSCDDDDVCNGVETCDPATGCKPGTPRVCDDGDACTTDGCDASSGCTIAPFTGFELPKCRLTAAIGVVTAAPGVSSNIRNKVLKKLGIVETKLGAASTSGLPVKKVRKALKVASKQLGAATKLVTKQRGKKIPADAADAMLSALSPLPALIVGVTP
jgi:cysteine-rich repeat protein